MRLARVLGAVAVGVVLVAGLTACSLIKDRIMTPDPPVKELQREAALFYRDWSQPDVERLRFTQDGGRPGLGASWSVNAVATVKGVDYEVLITPHSAVGFVGDNGAPPDAPTPSPHLPLRVVYSDGTSEVIE